ncbi:MAG: hypothetical protein M1419_02870 [Bacteroidetes bacterium]|nr:hypothetical protein [Bacteroidota bacterium]
MNHFTVQSFWKLYNLLPSEIQKLADKQFELLKENPKHPSLHIKQIENYISVRVGIKYRALGIKQDNDIIWFWIGIHSDYNKLLDNQ